jgi:hypothetical protein
VVHFKAQQWPERRPAVVSSIPASPDAHAAMEEATMTTRHIDAQAKPSEPEAAAELLSAAFAELEGTALDAVAAATGESKGAEHAEAALNRAASGVARAARSGVAAVRHGVHGMAVRLPATVRATRAGAHWTVETLQTLPDSTLRSLAATSVGLGAGLSFTRAGRLAALVGVLPAVVLERAIASRQRTPVTLDAAHE